MMNHCINCGKEAQEQHHVIPLSLGGNDIDSNKVWLCTECHNLIHNRNLSCGQLGGHSLNFRKAVQEHRVGHPKFTIPKEFYELYPKWKNKEFTAKYFYEQIGMKCTTFYKAVKLYEQNKLEEYLNN